MDDYFNEKYSEILRLANTPAGRFLLHANIDAPIVAVTHNSITYNCKPQLKGQFFSGWGRNTEILLPILTKMDIAFDTPKYQPINNVEYLKSFEHYAGLSRYNRLPQIYLSTNFYSNSDASAGIYYAGADWNAARGAAAADAALDAVGADISGTYRAYRYFLPTNFDTVEAGSDVTAMVANAYKSGAGANAADTAKYILTTQASNTALVNADFSALTLNSPTTYGTTAAFSGLNDNEYFATTMTSDAYALVEAVAPGYVKFGLRSTKDIDNTTPTDRDYILLAVGANRPYITTTWTPPSGGFFALL